MKVEPVANISSSMCQYMKNQEEKKKKKKKKSLVRILRRFLKKVLTNSNEYGIIIIERERDSQRKGNKNYDEQNFSI